jgi:hypothetical protein
MTAGSLLFTVILFICFIPVKGEDTAAVNKKSSLHLGIVQDNFYGLTIYAYGIHPVKEKLSLSYFIITRGTQFGIGPRFQLAKHLYLTPSIGLINGKGISGASHQLIGEGMVPSLSASYISNRITLESTSIYYKVLRKGGGVNKDFFWFWITAGYNLGKRYATGLQYEQLIRTRSSDGITGNEYRFIAPFIQAKFYKGSYFRFTAGYDTEIEEFIRVESFIHL